MDIFFDEHKELLRALLKADVEFILVGGYAVNVHGYVRATSDMDIWLKPDNNNKHKLAELLLSLNYDKSGVDYIAKQNFERPFVFHIGEAPLAVDFITKISGVTYDEADRSKKYLPVGDIQVPVLHLHHLILSKTGTGRLKDAADIEYLQKIEAERNKGKR